METEENLIPYHSTDLTGKRVLVLAPHPDDETIGCGGSLALHAKVGDPVKVVFLTNGAQGDSSGRENRETYVQMRKNEAMEACASLGVTDLEFWSYEDRALAGSRGAILQLMDLIDSFQPQLVYAPAPLEFHPDHRAACVLLCDAIRACDTDFEVAFYELGQPLSPNLLVDITQVLPQKTKAIDLYESQLKERPYKDISIALNRYRSMTLSGGATHAEGFSLWGTGIIRKIGPFSIPFQQVGRFLPGPGEAGPLVSVIVRTKDRPTLLANALRSIAGQTYANLEIVVVNDGGQDVKDVVTALSGEIPVTYIAHETGRGRAIAANSGLKAARGVYLNFLDDDDLFYPDHIETLVQGLLVRDEKIAYSNVLSAHFDGLPERPGMCVKKVVNHNIDFDPDRILFQNYLPIMSVLFHRDILSKVEGFSEDLTLFEDWDFWIRVSRHFRFHHVDKVTAEYRFYGVENAEKASREKYEYQKSLAIIFERNIPYFTGQGCAKFLVSDFPRTGYGREKAYDPFKSILSHLEEKDMQLNQSRKRLRDLKFQTRENEARLEKTDIRLKEACDAIIRLKEERKTSNDLLAEISSSKGWLWLSRYRSLKIKLGLNRAGRQKGRLS